METHGSAAVVIVVAVQIVGAGGSRPAAAQLLEPEFVVNSYTTGTQRQPAVAAHDAGEFVVVWTDEDQTGAGWDLFGQRFDAAGEPAGGEFRVNGFTTSDQHEAAVAALGSGEFVVAWNGGGDQDGDGSGVFARLFDASGDPLAGEFLVNSYTTYEQKRPAVAVLGAGKFVVVWQSSEQDGSGDGIFAQRFDAAGAPEGDEFRVNSDTAYEQTEPAVAGDGAGGFVVAWQSSDVDGYYDIVARRFDSAGAPLAGDFRVNTYTTYNQVEPAVAAQGSAGFVVVWESAEQDGENEGIYAQRYDAAGAQVGIEFRVNSFTTSYQKTPALASDPGGGFVVAWGSREQDGSYAGTFVQRFDPTGVRVGAELQVNEFTTESQKEPALAADGLGNFVVTWQSNTQDLDSSYAVVGRRFIVLLFRDGFEDQDSCAWNASVGGGC